MTQQLPRDKAQERRSGTRQIGLGVALLVVGAVLALVLVLVRSEASTAAAGGYVLLVAGVALLGNGVLLRRRGS